MRLSFYGFFLSLVLVHGCSGRRWANNFLAGLLIFLAAGCISVPIPTDSPFDFTPTESESIVGSEKKFIREKFGEPRHELKENNNENSYFIYRGFGEYWAIIFLLYIPLTVMPTDEDMLHCALLEFDQNDLLRRYDIKTRSEIYWPNLYEIDCRSLFWSETELAALKDVTSSSEDARLLTSSEDARLLTQTCEIPFSEANQLSDEDLNDRFYRCSRDSKINPQRRFMWICLGAHKSQRLAQQAMAHYFWQEYQATGVTYSLLEAYKWHSLVLESGVGTNRYRDMAASKMTPSQFSEAEKMVIGWQPDPSECEFISKAGAGSSKPN